MYFAVCFLIRKHCWFAGNTILYVYLKENVYMYAQKEKEIERLGMYILIDWVAFPKI